MMKSLPCQGSSICKAKKYAHQRAFETAFSKLLLVVLANGKVFVEVDTRKMSPLDHMTKLDMDNLLEVKDLDAAPPSDEDEDCD
ncbi:uncharacterized protein LOC135503088 isoform X2 [Lineus longissimus]|uniref:uncharacterized protein LOC135503088 isoform X2 n=1 Tax=Lineus longissimus TaxID=88925 RepID=UPI00315D3015